MGSFETDSAGLSTLNMPNLKLLCNSVNDLVGYPPYKLTMMGLAYYLSGSSQLRALPVLGAKTWEKGLFSSPGVLRLGRRNDHPHLSFPSAPLGAGPHVSPLKGLKMRSVVFPPAGVNAWAGEKRGNARFAPKPRRTTFFFRPHLALLEGRL